MRSDFSLNSVDTHLFSLQRSSMGLRCRLLVFLVYMLVVWVKGRKLTKILAFSNTELLHSLGNAHKPARI